MGALERPGAVEDLAEADFGADLIGLEAGEFLGLLDGERVGLDLEAVPVEGAE